MCSTARAGSAWDDGEAMRAPPVVVMGVSGSGKSTVGLALARLLDVPFVEGDGLHPECNVALMAAGTPLTDDDRAGWLDAVAARLHAGELNAGIVVSCSALKRSYRDRLRAAAPSTRFVHLHGSPDTLRERMLGREGHYMPASLLQSQLDILEPPGADETAIELDIDAPATELAERAFNWLTRPA
jgi:carbohydrate kinase (thermoresistant glucokinase family)